MMLFSNDGISIRRMDRPAEDSQLLLKWLTNPQVTALAWNEEAPWDTPKINRHFFSSPKGEMVMRCIIEYENRPIGYIQYYPLEKNSYRFTVEIPYERFSSGYGIDLLIGEPELWGCGIGTAVLLGMKDYLIDTLGAKVVCADPAEANTRSVNCCRKAGFIPLGKIADYDNPEITSILMIAE